MSASRRPTPWQALQQHHARLQKLHLRDLFAQDAKRAQRYTQEAAGWRLDYAKHRIDGASLRTLLDLAR
ncbi:MAG: glucose-6-phosphate isomerase, partial [Metallibacterium sp.]